MTATASRVLVVGMGLMGSALADALLQANLAVCVWNRTAQRCRSAVDGGATMAGTIVEGVRLSDVVVSCLAHHHAVQDTVTTPAVGEALNGKVLIQLSQATPEQSLGYAAWAERHRAAYLDGSILGYPRDVRSGTCDILYSGDPVAFASCRVILEAMGGRPRLVGDRPGIATAFDKAFFAFYYSHVMGLLHGAAICRAAGVPLEAYLDLMVDNWDWKLPDSVTAAVLRSGDHTVREGALETHAHAYNQVAPYCRKIGVDPRLADTIDTIMRTGIRRGDGGREIAALIDSLGSPDTEA